MAGSIYGVSIFDCLNIIMGKRIGNLRIQSSLHGGTAGKDYMCKRLILGLTQGIVFGKCSNGKSISYTTHNGRALAAVRVTKAGQAKISVKGVTLAKQEILL